MTRIVHADDLHDYQLTLDELEAAEKKIERLEELVETLTELVRTAEDYVNSDYWFNRLAETELHFPEIKR